MENESRLDSLMVHWLNFNNIAQNLLNTTDDQYERFFEKLYKMDKRSLVLFIKKNKEDITEEQLEFAKKYYEMRGRDIVWN